MNSMKETRESEDFARVGFCLFAGGILYPSLYRRRRTASTPRGFDHYGLLRLSEQDIDVVKPDEPTVSACDGDDLLRLHVPGSGVEIHHAVVRSGDQCQPLAGRIPVGRAARKTRLI